MRESVNVKLMINRIIVHEEKIIANFHAPNIPQTDIYTKEILRKFSRDVKNPQSYTS